MYVQYEERFKDTTPLCTLLLQDEASKHRKEVFKETEFRASHRSLGNIRFIGELFKLKVWAAAEV